MSQHTQIVFEKEETVLLRQSPATINEFCSFCGALAVMVTPETVTMMSGISEREIFRLIEASEIHFFEGSKVYVCLSSLNATEAGNIRQELRK